MSVWNDFFNTSRIVLDHIEKLEKENEKLRECLAYYADEENFGEIYSFHTERRGGGKARKCLRELEDK